MIKHFIGFGLFGSIVAFFVFGFRLLSSDPVPQVEVLEPQFSVTPWSYCDKKKRNRSVDTPRAIADRTTGKITLYINELPGGSASNSEELGASFTFYAGRGDDLRVIDVIHDSLVSSVRRDAGTKWTLEYQVAWVRGLSREDNLYVVPRPIGRSNGRFPAPFSIDSAMPVLIKN